MSEEKIPIGSKVFVLYADKKLGFFIPKLISVGVITGVEADLNNNLFENLYTVRDDSNKTYKGHYDPFYDYKSSIFFRAPIDQIKKAENYLKELNSSLYSAKERLDILFTLLKTDKIDTSKIQTQVTNQIKSISYLENKKAEVKKRLAEYLKY